MDAVDLQTLASELRADVRLAVSAVDLARQRFAEGTPAARDSAAHHVSRSYNVIEQLALRVAKAFENNIDDERGWHTELLRRLSLRIEGVRPALFDDGLRQSLQELRAFRHVFVHAYDLTIDPDKLALVLKYAHVVAERLPELVDQFLMTVAEDQDLEPPK